MASMWSRERRRMTLRAWVAYERLEHVAESPWVELYTVNLQLIPSFTRSYEDGFTAFVAHAVLEEMRRPFMVVDGAHSVIAFLS